MSKLIMPNAYFGPIEFFAYLVQQNQAIIEVSDNFQKQTYRNRCYIYGANGKLMLNAPIKHNKKGDRLMVKDVELANDSNWLTVQWKSIETAYRTSPYFEFYEDDLRPFFEKEHKNLLEMTLESIDIVKDILQEDWKLSYTEEYYKNYGESDLDLRDYFNAKKDSETKFPEYIQVFSNKFGFIPNLSILDLIFNEGPNAVNYLQNIDLKKKLS
jgi:hypothetical protein